ncbi:MAG: carbohydrate-binding domain-containing protein [Lachnospiraceae bacterium]|nr:carbohydrate-binding domain-containing protein [Lachnospiraceae bacterium]
MKRKNRKFYYGALAAILAAGMLMAGCGNAANAGAAGSSGAANGGTTVSSTVSVSNATKNSNNAQAVSGSTILDTSDLFSNRDVEVGYDESECVKITLTGNTAQVNSSTEESAVKVDGNVVTITDEGTYLISGTLNGQIIVEAEKSDKVQLLLDNASISCASSAALYVSQADKVFVTTTTGSENLLETTGEYVAIDDHNIDGAVFARDDITFNGEGLLVMKSAVGNGIVCKDDLKITSGTYEITAGNHGLQGKDSIRIANGTITITAAQDGIHSGNDEDDTVGYTYIEGGNITITADDDGIHSDTQLVIAGGTINVTKSYEGLEGHEIEILGGEINVVSSDDGLNAAGGNDGSGTQNPNMGGRFGGDNFGGGAGGGFGGGAFDMDEDAQIIISGGVLNVNAQGDGIDSNGNLYVYGGEIIVNGPVNDGNGALDFGGSGYVYGGSVIAIGSSGMAENFASDSTQCAIMVTSQSTQKAGTAVTLKNASGEVLLSTVSEKTFNNVVFSCEGVQVGETYTVEIGSETTEITMTETIYGSGNGFGGGRGGMGGFGGRQGMDGQNGFGGPNGTEGQNGFGGPNGMEGQNGFGGPNGTEGQNGFGGRQGMEGQNDFGDRQGMDGQNGFGDRQGMDGQNGFGGPNGMEGQNGFGGPNGTEGQNGFDGRRGGKGGFVDQNGGM